MKLGPISTKPLLALATTAIAALTLGGCSSGHDMSSMGGDGSPSPSLSSTTSSYGPAASGPHNDQDVTFATGMIPHHRQAVEMADMALARSTSAEVKALASQIKAAQGPEINQMSGWLAGWGKPIPTGSSMDSMTGMSGMSGGSNGMSSGDGMMSDAEMTALDEASGTQFAKLFLTGMIKHHQGAVAMAKTELADGQNSEAKQLAGKIVAAQDKEIATMQGLLKTAG